MPSFLVRGALTAAAAAQPCQMQRCGQASNLHFAAALQG